MADSFSDRLDAAGVREGQRLAGDAAVTPRPGGTRAEHLEWCKARARAQLDRDDWQEAWASMCSDLNKHDETRGHMAIELGMLQVLAGLIKDTGAMRRFIEGFN